MKLDPAIAELVGIDASKASVTSIGGGCSSATASKITAQLDDGSSKQFFMKTGSGKESAIMFEGKPS